MDLPDSGHVTGLAQLISSLMIAPAVMALRKIVKRHEDTLENHDERISDLELLKRKARKRRRW